MVVWDEVHDLNLPSGRNDGRADPQASPGHRPVLIGKRTCPFTDCVA